MTTTTENKMPAGTTISGKIQALKVALPRKYSPDNVKTLNEKFTEYKELIENLGETDEKTSTRLQANLAKLQQRLKNIEQPGNTVAASRYYFNEAINYMTIELINMGHVISDNVEGQS